MCNFLQKQGSCWAQIVRASELITHVGTIKPNIFTTGTIIPPRQLSNKCPPLKHENCKINSDKTHFLASNSRPLPLSLSLSLSSFLSFTSPHSHPLPPDCVNALTAMLPSVSLLHHLLLAPSSFNNCCRALTVYLSSCSQFVMTFGCHP